MMKIKTREELGDIFHDFLLCIVFGGGIAIGVTIILSVNQFLWNL